MQTETINNPILERYGVGINPVENMKTKLDKMLDRDFETARQITKDLIFVGFSQLDGTKSLIANALKTNLNKVPIETLIKDCKDFAKDNPKMMRSLLGKYLYKTIINY